jgi:hypothetical protein
VTAIDVTPKDESGTRFSVEVRDDDGSSTSHEVTVEDADWKRLGSGARRSRNANELAAARRTVDV